MTAATRRPASTHGPNRSVERDHRIVEATLDLLAEDGFDALTMENVAARASVAKATVYRRWATKTDLSLEALMTMAGEPAVVPIGIEPTLRAELVGVLTATTGCDDRRRHRVVAALAEAAQRHAVIGEAFERHFVHQQLCGLRLVVERAAERGEVTEARRADLLDVEGDHLEITAGPAMALYYFLAHGRRPDAAFIENIVDRVMLPLLT